MAQSTFGQTKICDEVMHYPIPGKPKRSAAELRYHNDGKYGFGWLDYLVVDTLT